MGATDAKKLPSTFDLKFVELVLSDAQAALARVRKNDTPLHRREAVRTIFAAIEGLAWVFRQHVASAAHDLGHMSPLLDAAFREQSYSVSETGVLKSQQRFITITAMFRLTARIARVMADDVEIDFSGSGWSNLKAAISVRNRLTHPKSMSDLEIDDDDLRSARDGIHWVAEAVTNAMEAVNRAIRNFNALARSLIDDLARGEPTAVALYKSVEADAHAAEDNYRLTK